MIDLNFNNNDSKRSGTPLLLMGQDTSRSLNFKLDYIKLLDDYHVFDNVPEMSKDDVRKMVYFFAMNDMSVANRPGEFQINFIQVTGLNAVGDTEFVVHFKNDLTPSWIDDFYSDFSNYVDNWMKKFIVVYGQYTKAAINGNLDTLLKKD